ncbi:MAG: SRPBCC family protein [Chthoniobacterales bacterium]
MTTPPGATPWEEAGMKDGVTIYTRTRAGSSRKEFRAIGEIDAPSHCVFAVLNHPELYPRFMPYTSETHVIERTKDDVVTYQRLDLPLVNDRDYTLRSTHTIQRGPLGPTYCIRWKPANDLGPAEKPGVQRVRICEGSWKLQPITATTTRATYTIYSDTGGAIPVFLANHGSRIAIRKLFAAIRKVAMEPQYAGTRG